MLEVIEVIDFAQMITMMYMQLYYQISTTEIMCYDQKAFGWWLKRALTTAMYMMTCIV